MLPDADADVDIDDLIDDEEEKYEEDDELELAADDLTTDEEEQHPTTSSSSSPPPATERVDDEASAAAAAAADTNDTMTMTTAQTPTCQSSERDDDVTEDKTSELTESQADAAELQSQQQPSINSDDVKPTTDDDLPGQRLTTDELQTKDTDIDRQEDVEELVSRDEDNDYMPVNNLADNRPEAVNDADDKGQVDAANQQVCQSTDLESSESDDVIPAASSAASATESVPSLSTSLEQYEHVEVVDTRQEEPKLTTECQEEDKEKDVKLGTEIAGQAETEQNERDVADELQVASHSELLVKDDHEPPDSSTTLMQEDHGTRTTETQQLGVHDETAGDVEKRSPISAVDDVKSQQDADEEIKVTEKSDVTEEADVTEQAKVTEEVKVTYEASAKQLDLLSRLAMLREKAAQRKAQQTSDTESTEDSRETSSCENHGTSAHRDRSTGPHDQSDGLQQQQEKDVPHALTNTDVSRRSVDINKDEETTSETYRQTNISTMDADAEQHSTEVTESPSHGITVDKSEPDQLVSSTHNGDHHRSRSPTVRTHDDTAETEVQTATTDNSCLPAVERATEKSTMPLDGDVSIAAVLNEPSKITNGSSDAVDMSTQEDADMNEQLQPSVSNSANKDVPVHEQHNEFVGPSTPTDLSVERKTAQRGSDQPGADSEISGGTTTATDFDEVSAPVRGDSDSSTEQLAVSELRGTESADVPPESVYSSSSGQREPTTALSDTATSEPSTATASTEKFCVTTRRSTGPTHPPDNDDAAINYDSDLDEEFADADALRLLSDIKTLKSRTNDGAGYLYVFADLPRRRFRIGASRSPARRLRQAITFNPDVTLLVCLPVTGRLAAVAHLRRRLLANDLRDVSTLCVPGSRDWFTGSDDVMTELVRQVAAADTADN